MSRALEGFVGHWHIERQIDDRKTGRIGTLIGQAIFTETPDGLRYDEGGVLEFPGQTPLTARQSYLWRIGKQGIDIFFADDRLFHSLDPGKPIVAASHDCPPDMYHVTYDFGEWPLWTSVWNVKGPRKYYISSTTYTRSEIASVAV